MADPLQVEQHEVLIFSEDTYMGRVKRFFFIMDPTLVFVNDEEIAWAKEILARGQETAATKDWNRALQIREACVHPDTLEPVVRPLRVASIVPMNTMLDLGMLYTAGSPSNVLFQFANQTYNALHYYANRNATTSGDDSLAFMMQGYAGAVTSSLGITMALRSLLEKSKEAARRNEAGFLKSLGMRAPLLRRFIPFSAVGLADLFNLSIVRRKEYLQGVEVHIKDPKDVNTKIPVGTSKIAGLYGVSACVAGRVLALIPILGIPPLLMHRWEKPGNWLARRPYLRIPVLMGLVATSIQFSVPFVFGIFAQDAQLPVSYLESKFHNLTDKEGNKIQRVSFNKGI